MCVGHWKTNWILLMISNKLKYILANDDAANNIFYKIDSEKKINIKGLSGSLKALFLFLLFEKKKSTIVYITAED